MAQKNVGSTLLCGELKPCLQKVGGSVDRRTTMPILSNLLVTIHNQKLSVLGTDTEIELRVECPLSAPTENISFTTSARSLSEICGNTPEDSLISFKLVEDRLSINVSPGVCHYALQTLPVEEFPAMKQGLPDVSLALPQEILKRLFQKTLFSMADDDTRHFLNGVLIEFDVKTIRAVTTDGHRLSFCEEAINSPIKQKKSFILPAKAARELQRLLENSAEPIELAISANNFLAKTASFTFTSNLIEGAFPDYNKVIPKNNPLTAKINKQQLKGAIDRAYVLVNENTRASALEFQKDLLNIVSKNARTESSEEQIPMNFNPGTGSLRVGLNIIYLKDVIMALDSENMLIHLKNENGGVLIEADAPNKNTCYVIMPMRL